MSNPALPCRPRPALRAPARSSDGDIETLSRRPASVREGRSKRPWPGKCKGCKGERVDAAGATCGKCGGTGCKPLAEIPRQLWKAINARLPDNAGQGPFWRGEVLEGKADYPPVGTSTPPRACGQLGDQGRLYPVYYGVDGAKWCCLDCYNDVILRRQISMAIYEGFVTGDGVSVREQEAIDAAAEAGLTPEDASPSAAVIRQIGEVEGEIVELKLEPDDEESLKRLIERLAPGHRISVMHPMRRGVVVHGEGPAAEGAGLAAAAPA